MGCLPVASVLVFVELVGVVGWQGNPDGRVKPYCVVFGKLVVLECQNGLCLSKFVSCIIPIYRESGS